MPLFCFLVSWLTIWRVLNKIREVCGPGNTPIRRFNCDVSVIRPFVPNTKMVLIVRPPRDSNFKYSKLQIVPNMRSDSTRPSWLGQWTRMFKSSPECSRAVQNSSEECSGSLEFALKLNFHVIIISWAYSRVSFHLGTHDATGFLYDYSLSRKDKIWRALILDTRDWSWVLRWLKEITP